MSPFFHVEEKFRPLERTTTKRLTLNKVKFFRTAGYTLMNHKRNGEILEDSKVEPVKEKQRR